MYVNILAFAARVRTVSLSITAMVALHLTSRLHLTSCAMLSHMIAIFVWSAVVERNYLFDPNL